MSDFTLGMSVLSRIYWTTQKLVFSPPKHQEPIKIADKIIHFWCAPDAFFNLFMHSGPHNKLAKVKIRYQSFVSDFWRFYPIIYTLYRMLSFSDDIWARAINALRWRHSRVVMGLMPCDRVMMQCDRLRWEVDMEMERKWWGLGRGVTRRVSLKWFWKVSLRSYSILNKYPQNPGTFVSLYP